jgi:membrane-bound metal-dependent hydrolase YbcI (DUF457 family)
MYILAHLAAGLGIGLLLAWLLRDNRWVIPSAIGAVLPDLVDKPLGHIVLGASLNYGRIYMHTMGAFLVVLAFGIVWWRWKGSPFFLAIAIGMLSHQILDAMWLEPWNWLYPFRGPFRDPHGEQYDLLTGIMGEITSPVEWAAGSVLIPAVLLLFGPESFARVFRRHRRVIVPLFTALAALVALTGLLVFFSGADGAFSLVTESGDPTENLLAGAVLLCASTLLLASARIVLQKPAVHDGDVFQI